MSETNLFISMLFGHFVGDFFLQPKSMAVKKGSSTGTALCHVAIYTTAVLVFTLPFLGLPKTPHDTSWVIHYFGWIAAIFVPHYLIDRYSLADKWLNFINGRSLEDFLWHGHKNIPEDLSHGKFLYNKEKVDSNYLILRGGFTCIVYVVVDNITHIACLWYAGKLFFS